MYTEPKCDWYDGCSLYERGLIEEDERRKNEELKALIKQIRQERAVEEAKIAVVEEVCIIFNVCIACFICRWRVVMTVLTHNIKKKSGKAERIFYIIKRFSTDKRDYRIQCSFTSIDKLKKYYPKRIIDQGVITNGINVSEISVDLRDL